MSIKERLKRHLKSVNLKLEEDEITRILNMDKIEFLNLNLLSRVIKNVKDNSENRVSRIRFLLMESMKIDNKKIEDFIEEIGEYLIDKETLEKKLEKSYRPSVLESAVIYSDSLQSIRIANVFRKNIPEDKIDMYLADAIRYTKKYINHVHDFSTFD
uniref:Uncharacterized protein n=1 Tax=Pithovirus LCPAC401 TaxID=2506595 RepID=A0A481ZB74_9VIRU|nr:MAG: uncharacterized protein LCPAC401_03430 [Pithovirus LCPAC401]